MCKRTSTPERTNRSVSRSRPSHQPAITGWYCKGRPYVTAGVMLPRPNLGGMVRFKLDTSSELSLLSPSDALRLGCPKEDAPILKVIGREGRMEVGLEQAVLIFGRYLVQVLQRQPRGGRGRAGAALPDAVDPRDGRDEPLAYRDGAARRGPGDRSEAPRPGRRQDEPDRECDSAVRAEQESIWPFVVFEKTASAPRADDTTSVHRGVPDALSRGWNSLVLLGPSGAGRTAPLEARVHLGAAPGAA